MPLAGTVIQPMVAVIGYMFLFSFGVVLYNVSQVSFRQRLCPRPMLGRMNASIRFLVWGVMPIGGFLGGVLGHQFGLRPVFWIEAFGAVLAATAGDLLPAHPHARPAARARPAQLIAAERLLDALRVVVPHPGDARVLAEPAVLPPGEPAGARDGPLPRLVLGSSPARKARTCW